MENFYSLLGIPLDADISVIRSSFRKKAKTCHPDLFLHASKEEQKIQQKKFVRLSQAYETLSDPKKRKIFDTYLEDNLKNIQQTNEQKKQRSSSFSSKKNKKSKFYKDQKKYKSTDSEDSLEDLLDDIKKMMDKFEVKFPDPLDVLVEWAMKIFQELTRNNDEDSKKNKTNDKKQFSEKKTNNHENKKQFFTVEDELEHLKKIFKSESKFPYSTKDKNYHDQIEEELRRFKKKYRI